MIYEEEYSFDCPYCGETNEIKVDLTAGEKQRFVYDCEVCCHPIVITAVVSAEAVTEFNAEKE